MYSNIYVCFQRISEAARRKARQIIRRFLLNNRGGRGGGRGGRGGGRHWRNPNYTQPLYAPHSVAQPLYVSQPIVAQPYVCPPHTYVQPQHYVQPHVCTTCAASRCHHCH